MSETQTVYEAFTKSDNLAIGNETLIGLEGFQIIEIEQSNSEEYVIY